MKVRNTIDWTKAERFIQAKAEAISRAAAEYMAERMRVHAPVDTGELSSTIAVLKSQGIEDLGAALEVTVHQGTGTAYRIQATAPYAVYVALGHVTSLGTFVPPNPFAQLAIAETAEAFPAIVATTSMAGFAGEAREFDIPTGL